MAAANQAVSRASQEDSNFINTTGNLWGDDQIVLNTTILDNFPISITRSTLDMNSFGLGQNSTILNVLYSTGQIASRTWSLFWGLTGTEAADQMDGTLILGGYDRAKVAGPNTTTPFTYGSMCATNLVVTISDIILGYGNGSSKSIIGSSHGSALRACVTPAYPILTLPEDVWEGYVNNTGGTWLSTRSNGLDFWAEEYDIEDM